MDFCIYLMCIQKRGWLMKTDLCVTTVFTSGNSQAVRLPKKFRFKSKKVEILKRDNEIILREPVDDLSAAYYLLNAMPKDFFAFERQDAIPQTRKFF